MWLIKWFAIGFETLRCTQALVDGLYVPHIDLWEPCCFTKVTDGPTFTLDVLWLQEGANECENKSNFYIWTWYKTSRCVSTLNKRNFFGQITCIFPLQIAVCIGLNIVWCGIPQQTQLYMHAICLACSCSFYLKLNLVLFRWRIIQHETCSYLEWKKLCFVFAEDLLSFIPKKLQYIMAANKFIRQVHGTEFF